MIRVFWLQGDKEKSWQIISLAVGANAVRPDNLLYHTTNHTRYPEEPMINLRFMINRAILVVWLHKKRPRA